MAVEKFTFQTEVSKLLDIVAHSLYSHKEIFLRELISNASDACDRLRYEVLTEPKLTEGDADFRITLAIDKKAKTLTVSDNGIGMDHDDLTGALGTIARSGTQAFVDQINGAGEDKLAMIGQFGVGFYSSFIVAKKVEVLTRKAGGKVTMPQLRRLVPAIKDVLERSIRDGGSTLRDFAQPDGELGYFATRFHVYGRDGEACHHEDGGTVRRIVQGGRSTWFCPICQK